MRALTMHQWACREQSKRAANKPAGYSDLRANNTPSIVLCVLVLEYRVSFVIEKMKLSHCLY